MSNLVYYKTPAKQRFHYTDFWPAMEYHWQCEGARICLICSVRQLADPHRKSQWLQAVATLLHEPPINATMSVTASSTTRCGIKPTASCSVKGIQLKEARA